MFVLNTCITLDYSRGIEPPECEVIRDALRNSAGISLCTTICTYNPHSDSEAKDERQESPKVEGPSQQVLDSIVYTWTCVPVVMHLMDTGGTPESIAVVYDANTK